MGFLKLLKGSGLREQSKELGLVYDPMPPYEIIKTSTLSAEEMVQLKDIEGLLEQYYNSHRFSKTLALLTEKVYESPFQLFAEFARFFRECNLHQVSHSPLALYDIFHDFISGNHGGVLPLAREALKFDFLRTEAHRPLRDWMPDALGSDHREVRHGLLQDPEVQAGLSPLTLALPPRELAQSVRVGRFSPEFVEFLCNNERDAGAGWIIFDHHTPDPWTSESAYMVIKGEE